MIPIAYSNKRPTQNFKIFTSLHRFFSQGVKS